MVGDALRAWTPARLLRAHAAAGGSLARRAPQRAARPRPSRSARCCRSRWARGGATTDSVVPAQAGTHTARALSLACGDGSEALAEPVIGPRFARTRWLERGTTGLQIQLIAVRHPAIARAGALDTADAGERHVVAGDEHACRSPPCRRCACAWPTALSLSSSTSRCQIRPLQRHDVVRRRCRPRSEAACPRSRYGTPSGPANGRRHRPR